LTATVLINQWIWLANWLSFKLCQPVGTWTLLRMLTILL